ncbi:hypothetical protein GUITHDRAFT_101359 [Guillardia theta CCMP2712]|uniref:BRO1 domain-containing protein n=1 Tax=Guillardia theta (strain CCMP2712) TaxID=905079 RepID=L1JX51_GUITC|nr:hypothetical protein GUITHDRAFT_101359 [Guillardia theta CCMP2712]EKX52909.1 hypothetical protein GUITHDRAFT_101359 [Guillardia theta CCMP2712]|mmetsp:Transcript_21687/g.71735  ORF Transcript_21687/g.71735 Transcript_21687/m.71735 type:complete len:372 (-) Transcript_21687:248-1363(-)|eukprot:XP_005839889.1 hypothetical protein GUITHDRAFT_101359 [Guillardia theta CCMP2712]
MSACGGLALTFPYPRTNPVDFSKFFPSKDYQIVELQTKTNALRNEMAAALVEQDAEKVLRTIDEYLPYLLGIQRYVDESIEKEGKRPLIPDLEFQWTSSFSRRTGTFFTFYTLAFEFLMVYTCRMISEGNIAASQLDSVATPADYENAAKGALARVKAAAGIAAYIHENVLPLRESLPYKRPPEVLKDFFRPIVLLYKCTAQQIATKQAAIKGMNRSLVAKLYVTAAKLLAECNVTLHQMDKDYNDFIPSLRAYSDGGSKFLKAVAMRYMAVDAWENKKFGTGEALIKEAHSYFEQALQSGVLSSASRSLAIRVDEEKTTIEKLKAQYEKENGLIYFEPAKKMEGVPEGKEITATDFTPYVPPTAVTFHVV